MNISKPILGIFTALGLVNGAIAAPKIAPGLWELTVAVKSQSGQLEAAMEQARAAMANMPPEQREMMEKMMESRGVKMDFSSVTVKTCVTPEEAELTHLPQSDNCEQEILETSDNQVKVKFNCPGNPPSSGEGEFTLVDDKTFTGKAQFNTTMYGAPEVVDSTQTGKWLSADCGDVAK